MKLKLDAHLSVLTAVVTLLVSSSAGHASLVAYDGFNYPIGSEFPVAADGGIGWSDAWAEAGMVYDPPPTLIVGGLNYKNLQASGGAVESTYPGTANTRDFNTVFQPSYGQTDTIWLSFLVEPTAAPTDQEFNGIVAGGGGPEIGFAPYTGHLGVTFYGIFGGGGFGPPSPVLSNVQVVIGQTAFLVCEVTFGDAIGVDATTLYVDPTPGLSVPDVSGVTSSYQYGEDILGGAALDTTGNYAIYDEIRYGTSYADVAPSTPVPEPPASLILLPIAWLIGRFRSC